MRYFLKRRYLPLAVLFDLFGVFRKEKKKFNTKKVKKILVIRLDRIGDIILSTPFFKSLRDNFPRAKITALVNPVSKKVLENNKDVDKIITLEAFWLNRKFSLLRDGFNWKRIKKVIKILKANKFDLGFNLRGDFFSNLLLRLSETKYKVGFGYEGGGFLLDKCVNIIDSRCQKHVVERNLDLIRALNLPVKSSRLVFNIKKQTKDKVKRFLKKNNLSDKKFILLHPGIDFPFNQVPDEVFTQLIDKLKKIGIETIISGIPKELNLIKNIVSGAENKPIIFLGYLNEIAALLERATLFVGYNSGMMHLADALDVPIIVIFRGIVEPSSFGPRGKNCIMINKLHSCMFCGKRSKKQEKQSITSKELLEAVKSILVKQKHE